MSSDTPDEKRGKADGELVQISALRWQKEAASEFLEWRRLNRANLQRMQTFGEAIGKTLRQQGQPYSTELASRLLSALASCDTLTFNNPVDVLAYAGLHLLDRYGRVSQILEYLMRGSIVRDQDWICPE